MVRPCGEKHAGICCNENKEDGSVWTLKLGWSDGTRKDLNEKGVKIEEAQDRRTWRLKTRCAKPK